MTNSIRAIFVFATTVVMAFSLVGQTTDSVGAIDSASLTLLNDVLSDSLARDSVAIDSLRGESAVVEVPKRKSALDQEVEYLSTDSMRVDLSNQMVYLYGAAVATYGDIKLEADYIEISLKTKELSAAGLPDSNGDMQGLPQFTQGDQTFRSEEMRYNFETKRGISRHVKTQESEGYLHGEKVKRDTGEIIYIKNGKYTTCEYDDPHFHIHANKMKVIPKDKIITGPAYLSIADIPTPLAVPFGFFPNTEDRANGLIIPSYGQSALEGFFLNRGGYYFGVKDIMDFAITGDIYTRGSWALYLDSKYKKRYKYNGSYNLSFKRSKFYDKDYPDHYSTNAWGVRWTHRQDPKARPNSSFNTSVDFGSSKEYRTNIQSTARDYTKSQRNSSISYSYRFPNSPFQFSATASARQNTQTQRIDASLPNASLTMSRIFPFESKRAGTTWLDKTGISKIGVNASLDSKNQITAGDSTLFTQQTLDDMSNGLQLKSTASTNIKLLKFITLSPSTSHKVVAYRTIEEQIWNADSLTIDANQINRPKAFYEGSATISARTIIYGTYQYRNDFFRAMRHQVSPSASFSYKPDYSDPQWGYYSTVQSDTNGNFNDYTYFNNNRQLFGVPGAQENGVVSFSLTNTFEAKIRNFKDTASDDDLKVKLLDALNFSSGYNLQKDSLNWSPVGIQVRTQIIKGLVMNGGATFDPYAINDAGRKINQSQFDQTGELGRWTNANVAFSYNFVPKKDKDKTSEKREKMAQANLNYDEYVDFDIPWKMSMTYNLNYSNPGLTETVSQVVDVNGEVNLTRNWRVQFRSGYDIRNQELSYTSFTIHRDLHCWVFKLNVVPFGSRQMYSFEIHPKSGVLQDLKLNRRRNFTNPIE